MKDLALYLVKNLVDQPDQVEVTATDEGDDVTRILVKVAEEDKGKIIGKQGKVIKAVRSVVGVVAAKQNRKVFVDLQ